MHLNIVRGDFIFKDWEDDGWKQLENKEKELKQQGYKKTNTDFDFLNMYVTYQGEANVVTLTMLLS